MTIEQQHGRAPDGSGSHPSDQAAMRPDLSGVDPSRDAAEPLSEEAYLNGDPKITWQEMRALFGDTMPAEAVALISGEPRYPTIAQTRAALSEIAERHRALGAEEAPYHIRQAVCATLDRSPHRAALSLSDAWALADSVYAALKGAVPASPVRADVGDLEALSRAATQGVLRGGHRCDGAIRVTVDGERVSLGEDIPAADAAYWAALANGHRAGSLTPKAPLPIETAPRDGTDILLFGRENSRRWRERPPVVAACDPQRWGSDEWFSHDDPDNPVDIHPTHWLPVKALASADGSPKGQDAGAA